MVGLVTLALVGAAGGLGRSAAAAPPAAGPSFPVEAAYALAGPHEVATDDVVEGEAVVFQLFFPADVANGAPLPVIVWGNGSFAEPDQYLGLLEHLASWGFVIVAPTTTGAGTGNEMRAGLDWLVAADADPSSQFAGVLDLDHVVAMGHSQGAGGTVRAATMSGGRITTTVTVALPNPMFVTPLQNHEFDPSQLTGPALFLSGSEDTIVSPPDVNRSFFDRTEAPAGMAVLTGADHNTIQRTGGRFIGYVTAWMRFQLSGDAVAAAAFTGPEPEARNPAWQNVDFKGLVAPGTASPPAGAPGQPAEPATPATPSAGAPGSTRSPAPGPAGSGRLADTGVAIPMTLALAAASLGLALGVGGRVRRSGRAASS